MEKAVVSYVDGDVLETMPQLMDFDHVAFLEFLFRKPFQLSLRG